MSTHCPHQLQVYGYLFLMKKMKVDCRVLEQRGSQVPLLEQRGSQTINGDQQFFNQEIAI